jgi:hypothetical protein
VGDVPPAEVERDEGLQDERLGEQRDATLLAEGIAGSTGEHQRAVEVAHDETGPPEFGDSGVVRLAIHRSCELIDDGRAVPVGIDQGPPRDAPGIGLVKAEGRRRFSDYRQQGLVGGTSRARDRCADEQVRRQRFVPGALPPSAAVDRHGPESSLPASEHCVE